MNDLDGLNNFIVFSFQFYFQAYSHKKKKSKEGIVKCFLSPGLFLNDIDQSAIPLKIT